ncbi:MAG: methyl-accepting chemotaxis protein, partial [Halobaculum sp.]
LKLTLVFALIVVVVGSFAVTSAQSTSALVHDQRTTQLTNDARQQAEALERWTADVENRANRLAASEAVRGGEVSEIRAALDERADSLPDGVVAVHYVADGEIAASTASPDTLPASVAEAASGSDPAYTDPYTSPTTDGTVTAYVVPTETGAVVYELDPRAVIEELSSGQGVGELVLVDASRTVVSAPDESRIGETHHEMGGTIPALATGDREAGFSERGDGVMAFDGVDGTPWAVMVHASDEQAFAVARTVQSSILGIVLMGIVSLVLFGSTVGSTTIIQMRDLSERAERVADGDLDLSFPTRRADEFGDVRRSLDAMRETLTEEIETAERAQREADTARREAEQLSASLTATATDYAEALEAAADGDLTRRLDPDDTHEAMARVGNAVDDLLAEYERTIRELSAFADDVTAAASEVTDRTNEVTAVSRRLAEELETIRDDSGTQRDEVQALADEIEDLSATAQQIAASGEQVETASETAADAAADGTDAAEAAIAEMDETVEAIDETVAAVAQLDEQVDRVTEVVDLIQDIADETNTLALNASIEAARAGEGAGGDGFAVVADEVKALAEETKQSAAEISEQLRAIREGTATAVEAADGADDTLSAAVETVDEALGRLDEIADHVADTDESVREISRATAEQADSTQQASAAITEVREISERTANDAAELASAADDQLAVVEDVERTASRLTDEADRLRDSLARFTVETAPDATGGPAPTAADDD